MSKQVPHLFVVGGCNGSGKSTYSISLVPSSVKPFDYDSVFLQIYHSLSDSELREHMAHNLAFKELENSINEAISNKKDFCYETNFNSTPMYWPGIFRKNGYKLEIFFFCLDKISEAKRRVQIRFQSGGHFVPDKEIEARFHAGYTNLDKHFREFDRIHLFDTSGYNSPPEHILSILDEKSEVISQYPSYLKKHLPILTKSVI